MTRSNVSWGHEKYPDLFSASCFPEHFKGAVLMCCLQHVIKALKELDFHEFVEDVQHAWDQFKEESKGVPGAC